MDRPIITVPRGLFGMRTSDWDIDWREQTAGTSTSGKRKILIGKLPRWVGAPSLVFRPHLLRQWRAHRWAGRGLTAVFRITMVDGFTMPQQPAIPFEGGITFADGAGWDSAPAAPCVGGAAPGDTSIVLDESDAPAEIAVGQILSHADWPFGVVSREALGDGLVRLGLEMPVRSVIPDGAFVDLTGVGLFEAVNPNAGNPEHGVNRIARTSMRLQEWLR